MFRFEEKKRRFSAKDAGWYASVAVAFVSGLFCIVVSSLLIANYFQIKALNPLDNPEIVKLRKQLADAPVADAALVDEIRAMDLLARKAFFTSQAHLRLGGFLLLAGAAVFVTALRLAPAFRPKLPIPEPAVSSSAHWQTRARTREVLTFAGGLLVLAALVAAYFTRLDFAPPDAAGGNATGAAAAPAYPDWESIQKQWPSFRGPGGAGVAFYTTAPTEWDAAAGKNIRWAVDVPLPGANSPVVWDKRVFLSGATDQTREVFCFDAENGQLLWRQVVPANFGDTIGMVSPKLPKLKVSEETGFAASTLAVHGDRVFAIFPDGALVCLDSGGQRKWGKNLGVPANHYGHASSLIAFDNLLFVQYDQDKVGKLFALDVSDGHEVWTAPRTVISWASPICVKTAFGIELVLNSSKDVAAYDPPTGKLLWQLECLDGEVAPSPAYGGGMFFVANDNATATAIRLQPGQAGPAPEIAWQWDEALPDTSSPVATDQYFFVATSRGEVVCLDAASGKSLWMYEGDEGFSASPIVVGDRVYVTDKTGKTLIFKTSAEQAPIAACPLGEETLATPAFLDGRIYFRTQKRLVCVAAN